MPTHLSSTAPSLALAALLLSPVLDAQSEGQARYELTFTSTWSQATHPVDWTSFAHFSRLVLGTHDANAEFWRPGGMATPGIRQIAETGNWGLFEGEVRTEISNGNADQFQTLDAMGTPTSRSWTIDVDADYPLITVLTMVAPSPDWFVGTRGLDLRPNGLWADRIDFPLVVWDSGTDSGTSYRSPNQVTNPAEPIARVTTASGPFQGRPEPIGTFTFRRIASTDVFGSGVNPSGSLGVTGLPVLGGSVGFDLNDPAGGFPAPASTLLAFSANAHPSFPNGVQLPGLGLTAGTAGEWLLGGAVTTLTGPSWNGSAVNVSVSIPNDGALDGVTLYVQGALAGNGRAGLTEAVRLVLGRP